MTNYPWKGRGQWHLPILLFSTASSHITETTEVRIVELSTLVDDHGLRGSASPVLTATGLVNGRWQFSTPQQNPHHLTNHQNIWYRWLRQRPLRLCQIWCTSADGGLWASGWNVTNFFIYTFFGNSPTGKTRRRIFTLDGSNDADSRIGVPFGGFVDIAPHFRGESLPPKKQFLGRE